MFASCEDYNAYGPVSSVQCTLCTSPLCPEDKAARFGVRSPVLKPFLVAPIMTFHKTDALNSLHTSAGTIVVVFVDYKPTITQL